MTALLDQDFSRIEVHFDLLLGHLHLLSVCIWNIEDGFDRKRDVSAVMELEFVWDLCVGEMFVELLIFVLGNISLVAEPNSLQIVNMLIVQLDWVLVENRVFSNNLFDLALS